MTKNAKSGLSVTDNTNVSPVEAEIATETVEQNGFKIVTRVGLQSGVQFADSAPAAEVPAE
ncbi:MAG: hypothetical protein ACK4TR_08915 [Phenylobacterium sp.]|uniref:hypothetical protein n=1 Tax=Phenylobacterium sp. TaxID=1871053 RepID=UPI00391AABD5